MQLEETLPSIERVRAKKRHVYVGRALGLFGGTDLLGARNASHSTLAAILVSCRAMVRTRTEIEREFGPARAAQMFRGEPPPPVSEELRHTTTLLGVKPIAACAGCAPVGNAAPHPGMRACDECSGTGRISGEGNAAMIGGGMITTAVLEAIGQVCPACQGHCAIVCATCEGTGQSMRAIVGEVTDTPVAFSYVYVPPLAPSLEEKVEAALRSVTPPPCLRIQRDDASGGLAGYAYGDRLDRARYAIDRAMDGGEIVVGQLDLFAWPLLVLKNDGGKGEAAILVTPDGEVQSFVDG